MVSTIEYRSCHVTKITSHENVTHKNRLTFSATKSPILNIHISTNTIFSVSDIISEWTKQKFLRNSNKIEDRPIEITIEITPQINGLNSKRKYDITTKISNKYGGKLNLLELLDLNNSSLQQVIDSGNTVTFNGDVNCIINIKTRNLTGLQTDSIELFVKQSTNLNIAEITNISNK